MFRLLQALGQLTDFEIGIGRPFSFQHSQRFYGVGKFAVGNRFFHLVNFRQIRNPQLAELFLSVIGKRLVLAMARGASKPNGGLAEPLRSICRLRLQ